MKPFCLSHVMLQQALLRQQPQSAAADASMSISCAQLEERLREMLGERKPPPPSSAPSPSSPVELRRMGRRISSANLEVSARCYGTHLSVCGGTISIVQCCCYRCCHHKRLRVTPSLQVASPMFRRKNSVADSETPKASFGAMVEGAQLLLA